MLAVSCFADSQVRIVRLSQVEGAVQVDRNSGQGYEKAFPNLPITQGSKLRTGADGRAEVEFEDGTTLRITPKTVVEFPELSARDSGAKNTEVKVSEGTAYLDLKATKDEEFTLVFGREKFVLAKPVHLRLQMGDTESSLAVFKGKVQVEGPAGAVNVGRDETATFDFLNDDKHTIAGNLEADPYDAWDAQQQNYHKSYAGSSSYSPYSYGMSDLNYYGNYLNVPGYGLSWQPYFTGAGWNPFMDGAWFSYPGFRLHLGILVSLGMDALPLRYLDVGSRLWLGVAPGKFVVRMEHLANCGQWSQPVCCPQTPSHWKCSRPGWPRPRRHFDDVVFPSGRHS